MGEAAVHTTRAYATPNAIQLRVSLDDISPVVWRRLLLPLHVNLRELHLILQAAFGWMDTHLHEFEIGGLRYGDAKRANAENAIGDARTFEERDVMLCDFTREPGTSFKYMYDFGDNWIHTVRLERRVALDLPPKVATCVEGARARPPEDVGGTSGYERFLDALGDPEHEDHRDMQRWCGGHFDPAWFDLALVNKDLALAFKKNVKRRPHQPRPARQPKSGMVH
jgi:Plasmid pRiA4b ORF-3-like protein